MKNAILITNNRFLLLNSLQEIVLEELLEITFAGSFRCELNRKSIVFKPLNYKIDLEKEQIDKIDSIEGSGYTLIEKLTKYISNKIKEGSDILEVDLE